MITRAVCGTKPKDRSATSVWSAIYPIPFFSWIIGWWFWTIGRHLGKSIVDEIQNGSFGEFVIGMLGATAVVLLVSAMSMLLDILRGVPIKELPPGLRQ